MHVYSNINHNVTVNGAFILCSGLENVGDPVSIYSTTMTRDVSHPLHCDSCLGPCCGCCECVLVFYCLLSLSLFCLLSVCLSADLLIIRISTLALHHYCSARWQPVPDIRAIHGLSICYALSLSLSLNANLLA